MAGVSSSLINAQSALLDASSGSSNFPISVAGGGTGSTNAIPGTIPYIGNDGTFLYSTALRFDDQRRQINLMGGTNSDLIQVLSANFAVTSSTTLANISASGSALSVNLAANESLLGETYSGKYLFFARLFTTSANTGGIKTAVSGTITASSIIYSAKIFQNGAMVVPATTRASALSTAVAEVTAVTVAEVQIDGYVKVSASGTLTIQFAQNASDAGASTVLIGSYINVIPVS